MDLKCTFLSAQKSKSKKTGNDAWYVSVSYEGRAKQIYLRELKTDLRLIPDPNNPSMFYAANREPIAVIAVCSVGGYGDKFGLDFTELKEA